MKRATIEALEAVCTGLEDLLSALKAEQSLRVDYHSLRLNQDVAVLRAELGQEDIEG